MKLVTTTGDFDAYCKTYLEKIRYVYEAGFRYIDLSLYTIKQGDELIDNDDWRINVAAIKAYAAEKGIRFLQAHGPNVNPLAGEEAFEKAVRQTSRAIEICGALGIPNMVVHPGWDKTIAKKDWLEENRKFFSQLFPIMEKYNVNILHENTSTVNMSWYFPKTGAEMVEFSEYVNHPMFHSCWDTGHANMEGSQYDEIMTIGQDLYAIHFNDNRGSRDEHIIPFMGTLNLDEVMHALQDVGYQGAFTLEASSTLRPGKYWLGSRRKFETDTRLFQPPLQLQKELEKFLYKTGKYILESYGLYEE